jgi:hypothetical protein
MKVSVGAQPACVPHLGNHEIHTTTSTSGKLLGGRKLIDSAMKTIFLTARKLDSSPNGNRYMLAVGPNPDPGLSLTPISDHSYTTLDQLCEVIDRCEAMEAIDVAALQVALGDGKEYVARISEESAECMGFKI